MPRREMTLLQCGLAMSVCYLAAGLLGAFLAGAVHHQSFFAYAGGVGDNDGYLALTKAVLSGNLSVPELAEHERLFLGAPLAAALISAVTGLDPKYAFPLLCWLSIAATWYLCQRSYGSVESLLTLTVCLPLVERAIYGGPEAPALALSMAGLSLARSSDRWRVRTSAFVLGCAICIRPPAAMFLVAVICALWWRKERYRALESACVGLAFVGGYLLFVRLAHLHSDPIGGYRYYWLGASPVSLPFLPLFAEFRNFYGDRSTMVKQIPYIFLIVFVSFLVLRRFRPLVKELPFDTLAFLFSAFFLFSYNAGVALADFARYSIFCIPFAVYILWRQILVPLGARPWMGVVASMFFSLISALSSQNLAGSLQYFSELVFRG